MAFGELTDDTYDLVIIGSGFGASFFLARYLETAAPTARIAVIERGPLRDHATRIATRADGSDDPERFHRRTGVASKRWMFTLGFGGGTNCWWGNVPRFLPDDFRMRSRFGVGRDWPVGYDDLAPFYDRAEAMMQIAGADGPASTARRVGYPQPAHRMTDPERLLKAAYPGAFFPMPSARARIGTPGRATCCGNGVCHMCPVDAKFTVLNAMMAPYEDPRVTIVTDAEVWSIDHAGNTAGGVRYFHAGTEKRVRGDLLALAANALFNPVILSRSGLDHPLLGRRLHEQVGLVAEARLDGLDSFQGSTSVTGIGYMLYEDAARRRDMAACLLETWNVGRLRTEFGKWRQVLPLRMVFDSLPDDESHVATDAKDGGRPTVHYAGHGAYTQRAIDRAKSDLERILAPLPIESVTTSDEVEASEAHIIGTTVMGDDPADSIVDRNGVHHRLRNLVVLGSSTFPVGGPANPSLTIAALAMRSAQVLAA